MKMILGQNCVRISDAALDDFFSKYLFYQKQCKYAMNVGIAQVRGLKSVLLYLCRTLPSVSKVTPWSSDHIRVNRSQ